MIVWITGLSGAGKTTLASKVYEDLKSRRNNVVFLDGDILREVLGSSGYTYNERYKQARKIHNLCKMLENQGIDVVCATMSLFHQIQKDNRAFFKEYYEIYIKVDLDRLIERDQKGLYSGALVGRVANVVGIDVPCEEPLYPDVIIENNILDNLEGKVNKILEKIN